MFAGYRLERQVSRGGMGVVFEATHVRLSRTVALKLLAPELAEDDEFRTRFLTESQLAAGLEHANVVPVYDGGEENGVLYLAMRYLRGGDLRELLRREGRLSLERTVAITDQIASALDAAHALGLVHRDVKPANIIFEEGRRHAFLADFGVARSMSATGLTRTGSFLGTVDYCAPEQVEGRRVDRRADVYALGGVAFHCLTGQPPYVRETELAVLQAHVHDAPPALSNVRPDLPRALDGVFATAMAKYPDVRHESAGSFADALREAAARPGPRETVLDRPTDTVLDLTHLPPPVAPGPPTEPLPQPAPAPAPVPVGTTPPRGGSGRGWLVLALVAGAVLIGAAAVGATLLLSGDDEPREAAPGTTEAATTAPETTTEAAPVVDDGEQDAQQEARRANRQYANTIDGLLIDSARTRSDLGSLIQRVNGVEISHAQAAAEIDAITEQRRELLRAVRRVEPPPPFTRAAALLRQSLEASIENDLGIEYWIDARYAGDAAAESYHWERNGELSDAATALKARFLEEYNAKRRELLDRPPLDVAY